MRRWRWNFVLLLFFCGTSALLAPRGTANPKPIPATVCSIVANSRGYDNKLVKVSGYLLISAEYSILGSDECQMGIWFVLDGNAPHPGMIASVNSPKATKDYGRPHITPVKDAAYEELRKLLERSAKAESCLDDALQSTAIPDCRRYRIVATFIGRIDGVRSTDAPGYGHMGMFKAQLVVQRVEDPKAVERSDPETTGTRSPGHR